jgi:hypothetical protein
MPSDFEEDELKYRTFNDEEENDEDADEDGEAEDADEDEDDEDEDDEDEDGEDEEADDEEADDDEADDDEDGEDEDADEDDEADDDEDGEDEDADEDGEADDDEDGEDEDADEDGEAEDGEDEEADDDEAEDDGDGEDEDADEDGEAEDDEDEDGEDEDADEDGEAEDDEDEDGEDEDADEDGEAEDDEDEDGEDSEYEEEVEAELETWESIEVSEEIFSVEEYSSAIEADWQDDTGDWSDARYEESARRLFGKSKYFNESWSARWEDQGYRPSPRAESYRKQLAQVAPQAASAINFVEKDGELTLLGFVTIGLLKQLRELFPNARLGKLRTTLKKLNRSRRKPKKLPNSLKKRKTAKGVDLRKFCTPIGDQKQTSRCCAFAMTHAVEMVANMVGKNYPRLSPSFTMWNFQKAQGDARDFQYAAKGGRGTSLSRQRCAQLLAAAGTCRQELWEDDSQSPAAKESAMAADAKNYKLTALARPVGIDDLKTVLSQGCPVSVCMTTGPAFSSVARDGRINSAEKPSGQHGYHAMLMVGFVGNFFIIKNSWGHHWGDQGYCYVPKSVLAQSKPEFVAIVVKKSGK